MALKDEIQSMKTIEQGVANNKVVNFAYTNKAYTDNDVNGVDVYDFNNDNNIPTNNPDVIKVNPTVIVKGYRAQASSITRMLVNHIFGRVSYNLNKTTDLFTSLLDKLGNALGEPNGIATLDADGRIPFSQLPETAVEYKGEWNAETNTPTLVNGTGIKGDMYYVSVGGTQNLGSGNIDFLAGDRIIYNGSIWQKLSGGSVKKVNNIRPDDTGNVDINNYPSFTYVVDSNQKLLDWANNEQGNDYSSVLIKKGTWSSSVGVNLSNCGTKVVVGEVGSKLSFTDVEKGLHYDEVPTNSEYYMLNVNVQVTKNSNGYVYSFYRCTNLTNCTGTSTGTSRSFGFSYCDNLTNCRGISISTGTSSGSGFASCTNLANCTGTGSSTYANGTSFERCDNLVNCTGEGSSTNSYGFGFASCTNLANCTGTGSSTYANGISFDRCDNLVNCTGTGYGYGYGKGFDKCTKLTNCSGTGTGTEGTGFSDCSGVSKCKAGGNCTSEVFLDSYASQSMNNTYACADTPEGGFNNTTNPSS